jgi:predicted alpha/beta-hydrolase family hydrolase
MSPQIVELETPHGQARAHLSQVEGAAGSVVLGHGAGGGIDAADLRAAARAAARAGFSTALVEQPYRVAGRRAPPPAGHLDAAWLAIVDQLRATSLPPGPLVSGGRSAGARVACRTAGELAVDAVLCLAFPVHPPGKADDPSKSRLPELEAVAVPVLVVQGESDPFGRPPPGAGRKVVLVPGTHSLKATAEVESAVGTWLAELL